MNNDFIDMLTSDELEALISFFRFIGFNKKVENDRLLFYRDKNTEDMSFKYKLIFLTLLSNNNKGVSKQKIKSKFNIDPEDVLKELSFFFNTLGLDLLCFEDNYVLAVKDQFKSFFDDSLNENDKIVLIHIITKLQIEEFLSENSFIFNIKSSLGYNEKNIRQSLNLLEDNNFIRRITKSDERYILLDWKSMLLDKYYNINSIILKNIDEWVNE